MAFFRAKSGFTEGTEGGTEVTERLILPIGQLP